MRWPPRIPWLAAVAWAGVAGAQAPTATGASLGVRDRFSEAGWVATPTLALGVDERLGPWTMLVTGYVDVPSSAIEPARRIVGQAALRTGAVTWRSLEGRLGWEVARRQHGAVDVRAETGPSLHVRYASRSSGAWLDLARTRAGRAQPGITESNAGWWLQRGALGVGVIGRSTQFRSMLPVGQDSAVIDRSGCEVEHDPTRPYQQYRTLCPALSVAGAFGVRASWQRRETAVEAVVMRELGYQGMNGPVIVTGELRVVRRLADRVALQVGFGRQPPDPARAMPSHSAITAGIQLVPTRRIAVLPRTTPPAALATRDGIVLHLGEAQVAEVQGDFTGWRPEPMVRLGGGRWRYAGVLAPGPHSFVVRMDGGAWQVPSGVPTASDGFGGTVGIVVVP